MVVKEHSAELQRDLDRVVHSKEFILGLGTAAQIQMNALRLTFDDIIHVLELGTVYSSAIEEGRQGRIEYGLVGPSVTGRVLRIMAAIDRDRDWLNVLSVSGQEPAKKKEVDLEIEERLNELQAIAIDENITPSAASERDLRRFLELHAIRRRPYLFLLDNGNFRALWKNAQDEEVGLQFLGGGEVQYVIFAQRSDSDTIVSSCGRDNFKGIDRLIDAHDSWDLIES